MSQTLRVAVVQAEPAFLDLGTTMDRLEAWTRRAADAGARVVAFPETWLPGYPVWLDVSPGAALWESPAAQAVHARLYDNAVEVPGPITHRLETLARDHNLTLIVGIHERAGRTLYNGLLVVTPEGLAVHHRKLVPTYSERMVWGHGDGHGLQVAHVEGVRVGGLVCWEHWMPLTRQRLHDLGEQVHAALWPAAKDMHHVASRHYAFEGRCFVLVAGSVLRSDALPSELPAGDIGPWALRGGSAIIAPDGRYLAGPIYDEEALVCADIDLSEITRQSMTLDVSGHYSRPDVFSFGLRDLPPRADRS